MLHIILLILKIIGWILLAVLGLIVLLICITLFVPFRYRVDARCGGTLDSLYGRMRFSWLAHLVSGFAVYDGGKLDWSIRIAWKKIKAGDEVPPSEDEDFLYREKENIKQKSGKKKEIQAVSVKEDAKMQDTGIEEAVNEITAKEAVSDSEVLEKLISEELESDESEADVRLLERLLQEESTAEGALEEEKESLEEKQEKIEGDNAGRGQPEAKDSADLSGKIEKLYQRIYKKLSTLYEKIKYTFHKICGTIKSLLEKKDKLAEFISDEAHRTAFFALLVEVKRLLCFLKPKELKADIHFGFEDPSITGRVLAVISMVYPFIGEHADIEPDFEQKVLEGELAIAGRIRVLYAVIMLWNLVWNKNVRITFKHIRKFEL